MNREENMSSVLANAVVFQSGQRLGNRLVVQVHSKDARDTLARQLT